MEWIFVLAAFGGGAYWHFRGNIRRGAEIMRAHLFLLAVEQGRSVADGNRLAAHDMSEATPEMVRSANSRATKVYGGIRLAMVADAYRLGMFPKLSVGEREKVQAAYAAARGEANNGKPAYHHARAPNEWSVVPRAASGRAANEWAVAPPSSSYAEYYAAYIAELKRLSGLRPEDHHRAELMEEIGEAMGDNLTRENFERGVDPKEYAAVVHTEMQRVPPNATPL